MSVAAFIGEYKEDHRVQTVEEFVAAARADGWAAEQPQHAGVVKLQKQGFVLQVILRTDGSMNPQFGVWGPDGLGLRVPDVYDWEALQRNLRRCNFCDAADVEVFRVGFAGRCCEKCLPEQRKRLEFPGWAD